jgi:thiopeptide-type bacteriocin biosynthesis protein
MYPGINPLPKSGAAMDSGRFFTYDFFVYRIPTLSVESVMELNHVLGKVGKGGLDGDCLEKLRAIFSNPLFVEGIYLASKDLYTALQTWLNHCNPETTTDKLLMALYRYYSRMCTRCTPYGLFAGCASGEISDRPTRVLFARDKIRKCVRFDMDFVIEVSKLISTGGETRDMLKFYVNNSLYLSGSKYVFVENVVVKGKHNHVLSGLTASPFIDKVIARARSGGTVTELVQCLLHDGVREDAAVKFVEGLIAMQVLTSEFQPTVDCDGFVSSLIEGMGKFGHLSGIRKRFVDAYETLMTGSPSLPDFAAVETLARQIVPDKDTEIIQEHLSFRMADNNFSSKVIREIAELSERLWTSVPPNLHPRLDEFIRRFSARYEEQEVPLCKALDPDIGIGFGLAVSGISENMPLINGVAIRASDELQPPVGRGWAKLLLSKIKIFFQERKPVISLTEEDVDGLIAENTANGATRRQNTSAYVFGSIIAESCEEIDAGQYKFIANQLHGFGNSKLLGRFAQWDEVLYRNLKRCTDDEESANRDVIVAELVHMPDGRGANVVLRPKFRMFEIPYLCKSSVEDDHQITIDDLLVSIRGGRVVLRSKKHNKEVLPQITNAYNSLRGQATYQFMAAVCDQFIAPWFKWNWTGFTDQPWLPRVEYRNIILARARWFLRKESDSMFSTQEKVAAYIQRIRHSFNIPKYVVLIQDADNELFLDLENAFCQDHLVKRLKTQDVILFEFLHTPENCFIKDAYGSYTNQIIIPLGTKLPAFSDFYDGEAARVLEERKVTRSFAPGSEWLFVKIYTGNKTMERILLDIIKPIAEDALREKAIDKWFFIRYADPDGHLRVRFHCSENHFSWPALLVELNERVAPFISSHEVAKMMVDTYVRELERYGESTIAESESIFFFDSMAVVNLLDMICGDEGEQLRWQMGLYGIDILLNDFGFTLNEKAGIIDSLRASFLQEFSNSSKEGTLQLERSLNSKYRQHYPLINSLLCADVSPQLLELTNCFRERSLGSARSIAALKEKISARSEPNRTLTNLVSSYIHMHMNRIFLSRRRVHELVLYHYLSKYYQSAIARSKYETKCNSLG